MKHNLDSGQFTAIQEAGVEALKNGDRFAQEMRNIYSQRSDICVNASKEMKIEAEKPK